MKHLKNLGVVLTKNELKSIVGGLGTCAAYQPEGSTPTSSGSYTGTYLISENGNDTYYGVSQEEAQWLVSGGGYWCCDSCDEASWYDSTYGG